MGNRPKLSDQSEEAWQWGIWRSVARGMEQCNRRGY